MLTRSSLLAFISLASLLPVTGCSGFFFKEAATTTGTGTGTGTGSGTSAGDYVFIANSGANSAGMYTVTGLSISAKGALAAVIGSPITFNVPPVTLAVSRDNKFLWVGTPGQIFGFSLSTTGAITALNSGNALLTVQCIDMQTTSDGKWLMVLDGTGNAIDLFAINTDGTLLSSGGAQFVAPSGVTVPHALRIAPNGNFVVAALGTAGELVFTFDTATGVFTALPKSAGAPPGTSSDNGIAIDPTSSYLYIARSGTAAGLIVDNIGTDGTLTPTTKTPYATGPQPYAVTLDKLGKYVYVANRGDGTISGYTIGTNVALTAISGALPTAGAAVQALGTDSTGLWLLAAAFSGNPDLTLYGFDTTTPGRLTSVTSSPTGTNASAIAFSH